MGLIKCRARTYYFKLFAIWISFGACAYLYYYNTRDDNNGNDIPPVIQMAVSNQGIYPRAESPVSVKDASQILPSSNQQRDSASSLFLSANHRAPSPQQIPNRDRSSSYLIARKPPASSLSSSSSLSKSSASQSAKYNFIAPVQTRQSHNIANNYNNNYQQQNGVIIEQQNNQDNLRSSQESTYEKDADTISDNIDEYIRRNEEESMTNMGFKPPAFAGAQNIPSNFFQQPPLIGPSSRIIKLQKPDQSKPLSPNSGGSLVYNDESTTPIYIPHLRSLDGPTEANVGFENGNVINFNEFHFDTHVKKEDEIGKDVLTRDISLLSHKELIYRFVHNPRAFLSGPQKGVPGYLKDKNVHWTFQYAGEFSPELFSPPPNELPDQRLPQAIIIGAGKCGTRALVEFLSMHPLVVAPEPEIHFFDNDNNFARGLDWYRGQMPLSYSNQMTIEKTPSYMWSERALKEIHKMNSSIKLVAIIRNPVDRVISQASRGLTTDIEHLYLTLDETGKPKINGKARTVGWGVYVKYLSVWLDKYSSSQLHIIEAKELIKNPTLEMQKLEKFLGLPPRITEKNFYFNVTKGFYCMHQFYPDAIECLPETKGKKHIQLNPEHEKMLYDFYTPYNEDLFALLKRRYNWVPKSEAESSKFSHNVRPHQ